MTDDQTIVAFFDLYAASFSRYAVDDITALWSFPALITAGERSVVFEDEEAFARNTTALCSFYQRQGVVTAEKTILSAEEHFPGVVTVRTGDRLLDHDGVLIAEWEHVYLIRREGARWKAMVAIADGEAKAWEARGTVLGGS